ncbi:MAG: SPASM domain-containing protein [Bacteroidota bacterium]
MAESIELRIKSLLKEIHLPEFQELQEDYVKQMASLLLDNGLLPMSDEELFKLLLTSYNITFFSPIINIEVQFTEDCNLACTYCFVVDKRKNKFSAEMGKRALDFLVLNSGNEKNLVYTFFGGEPLLEFESMYKVMEYSKEVLDKTGKKTSFNATTNGLLLTKEILMKCEGMLPFLLSIDGNEKTHDKNRIRQNGTGSFKEVFSKIELLKKYQGWVGTKMTITPETVYDIMENVDFLFKSGVNQFLISPSYEYEWSDAALKEYGQQFRLLGEYHRERVKKGDYFRMSFFERKADDIDCLTGLWGCHAGRTHAVITYTGDIYPCTKFIGLEGYQCEELYLGNIFDGLTNLRARERMFNLTNHMFSSCGSCTQKNACGGGCPADNYYHNKSLYKPVKASCDMTHILHDVYAEYNLKSERIEAEKKASMLGTV